MYPLRLLLLLLLSLAVISSVKAQEPRVYSKPKFSFGWEEASAHPDHIVLNLTADPSTSMSVSWRTSTAITVGYAEIAVATAAPKFWRNAVTHRAEMETMDAREVRYAGVASNYYTVNFKDLKPNTLYAYRVGDGNIWSEWIQFKTANQGPAPFRFLYVGDAQNYILELWSRLIREGYRKAPDASFIIHAGDLVSEAHSERQWHEWFSAGGWIHRMLPSISTPGNHEYRPRNEAEVAADRKSLSVQWRPQFNLPLNGPKKLKELEETVYFLDYQDTRIISLNSNTLQAEQVPWLDSVLANNPMKWTVVTYHHPLFSASERRNNEDLRSIWKPLFDKYKVDLVLQGHDHSYARGRTGLPEEHNIVAGLNKRDYTGTVYVVSVSGGKMYRLRPNSWNDFEDINRDRAAENTQLFQLINIDGNRLSFEAYTATGELYDAFDLIKEKDRPNRFIERLDEAGEARRFSNTIHYMDQLPEDIKKKMANAYPGYEIKRVTYVKEPDFEGYFLRMYKGKWKANLKLDDKGNVLEEKIELD